ncbi:MAG: Holliday junction branch migration protein RuvA [Patescibacteria group bacterium]|jgi:Holliday junction DNA helicase RuvA|nr:Holliday junction branch migration protein RuvA [Patescibacteria group bacterium]
MLSFIKGKIKFKDERSVIIQTGDLGFEVYLTEPILKELILNQEVELFTYLHTRENIMELYGFINRLEMNFFEKLIEVPGIGPKSALSVLSLASPDELIEAINQDNVEILTKVSGIGKKTAQRIVVELKTKLNSKSKILDQTDSQTFDALQKLGYSVQDIRQAIKEMPTDVEGLENKVKAALKILGK